VQFGAALAAVDLGQVNPWHWDDAFKTLLWDNSVEQTVSYIASTLPEIFHPG
jgi:hypothetical protein